jgi:VanZ family protein
LLPLRYPKIWFALGCTLVSGVVIGSFLPGDVVEIVSVNDKLMHVVAYFVLAVWFAGLYRRGLYPLVGAALLALGVGIDLVQGLTPTRHMDVYDMVANFFGIVVGLSLSVLFFEGWCQRLERRLLT